MCAMTFNPLSGKFDYYKETDVAPRGTAFPTGTEGDLFYRTDLNEMYVYTETAPATYASYTEPGNHYVLTAVTAGVVGNSITFNVVKTGNTGPIIFTVTGTDITINPTEDGSGNITSTDYDVFNAWTPEAYALANFTPNFYWVAMAENSATLSGAADPTLDWVEVYSGARRVDTIPDTPTFRGEMIIKEDNAQRDIVYLSTYMSDKLIWKVILGSVVEMYVNSTTGDNLNHGFDSSHPVANISEAFRRVTAGVNFVDVHVYGDTSGPDLTNQSMPSHIRIRGGGTSTFLFEESSFTYSNGVITTTVDMTAWDGYPVWINDSYVGVITGANTIQVDPSGSYSGTISVSSMDDYLTGFTWITGVRWLSLEGIACASMALANIDYLDSYQWVTNSQLSLSNVGQLLLYNDVHSAGSSTINLTNTTLDTVYDCNFCGSQRPFLIFDHCGCFYGENADWCGSNVVNTIGATTGASMTLDYSTLKFNSDWNIINADIGLQTVYSDIGEEDSPTFTNCTTNMYSPQLITKKGTTFPTYALKGDLFYRTDLDATFQYTDSWKMTALYSPLTIYVNSTGDDANDGFTQGSPKATLAGAIAALPSETYSNITIQCDSDLQVSTQAVFQGVNIKGTAKLTLTGTTNPANNITVNLPGDGYSVSLTVNAPATGEWTTVTMSGFTADPTTALAGSMGSIIYPFTDGSTFQAFGYFTDYAAGTATFNYVSGTRNDLSASQTVYTRIFGVPQSAGNFSSPASILVIDTFGTALTPSALIGYFIDSYLGSCRLYVIENTNRFIYLGDSTNSADGLPLTAGTTTLTFKKPTKIYGSVGTGSLIEVKSENVYLENFATYVTVGANPHITVSSKSPTLKNILIDGGGQLGATSYGSKNLTIQSSTNVTIDNVFINGGNYAGGYAATDNGLVIKDSNITSIGVNVSGYYDGCIYVEGTTIPASGANKIVVSNPLETTSYYGIYLRSLSALNDAAYASSLQYGVYIGSDSAAIAQTICTGVTAAVGYSNLASATIGGTETLSNKTLTTPTITDLTNMNHTHADAAGGGQLDWDNVWSDAVHNHTSDAEGGVLSPNVKPISEQTANFSVSGDNGTVYVVDATAGEVTATLPASPTTGQYFTFVKTDATNNLIIKGETPGGVATWSGWYASEGWAIEHIEPNDVSFSGEYTGTHDDIFIDIDSTGTPDTYDIGPNPWVDPAWVALEPITGSPQMLYDDSGPLGVSITFASTTGHGEWDYWIVTFGSASGHKINGASTQTISSQYSSITVVYDGTEWRII